MLSGTAHYHCKAPQAKGGIDKFGYIMVLNDPNQSLPLEKSGN